jgi:hypothetical protein
MSLMRDDLAQGESASRHGFVEIVLNGASCGLKAAWIHIVYEPIESLVLYGTN